MNYRNPNKPVRVRNPRPEPREHTSNTGDAARDGYTVTARRPRVAHHTEPMDPDRADRIEDIFGESPGDDLGY